MACQRFFVLLTSSLLFGVIGCSGGGKSTPTVPEGQKVNNPVKGQVIMEGGRSPEKTLVKFYKENESDDDMVVSRGGCDSFGYFVMSTSSAGDGVPPGKYKVLLFQTARPPRGSGKPSPVDALGNKYNDINNPVFVVDVPQGGKEDLQFKVTPLTEDEIQAAIEELKSGVNRASTREQQGKTGD